jgi:beta-lactamase class A
MSISKFLGILLVISIFFNIFFLVSGQRYNVSGDETQADVSLEERYPLLSRRILHEFNQDILINFLDLRNTLRSEVSPYGSEFGFYFEYLPTGTTIGVNEKENFHAASLFKVPVVMAYYHMRERTGMKEDPEVTLTKDMLDSRFGTLYKRGVGVRLKASELVRLTLVDSDNTALKALSTLVERQDFEAVYSGLDIELNIDKEGALISAKNYASILKALYFSAVLSKESSNEILQLLTETNFPDKLAAGVPGRVPVAHKIGDFVDSQGQQGYRDCGIVYVPRRSYLLCMVSVGDEQLARDRMQRVSRTVYDFIAHQPTP